AEFRGAEHYRGKICDSIWECFVTQQLAGAYDAFYPVRLARPRGGSERRGTFSVPSGDAAARGRRGRRIPGGVGTLRHLSRIGMVDVGANRAMAFEPREGQCTGGAV